MQERKNIPIENFKREKVKETNAVELVREEDFEEDLIFDVFDEEGFEDSFFGTQEKKTAKTVRAVDILLDKEINENFDEDFEDEALELEVFDSEDAELNSGENFAEFEDEEDNVQADSVEDIAEFEDEEDNVQADSLEDIAEFEDEEIVNEEAENAETENAEVFNAEDSALVDASLATADIDISSNAEAFGDTVEEQFLTREFALSDKDSWKEILKAEQAFKPKFTLDMKLRLASENVQEYYSIIKNVLLSYGLHARRSAKKENFTKGKVPYARIGINGKTLKVYLAVDPDTIDVKHFRHKDVGFRKSTACLPTLINAKTDLSLKRICELIKQMLDEKEMPLKKKFAPTDFTSELSLEGITKISRCGFEYMLCDMCLRTRAHELPEFFAEKFINERKVDIKPEHIVVCSVTLEQLCMNFPPKSAVKLADLIEKGVAGSTANYLQVKASESMDRPLYIYCDDITPTAAKMVCLTRGQIFRYSTNKVDYIHLQLESKEQEKL